MSGRNVQGSQSLRPRPGLTRVATWGRVALVPLAILVINQGFSRGSWVWFIGGVLLIGLIAASVSFTQLQSRLKTPNMKIRWAEAVLNTVLLLVATVWLMGKVPVLLAIGVWLSVAIASWARHEENENRARHKTKVAQGVHLGIASAVIWMAATLGSQLTGATRDDNVILLLTHLAGLFAIVASIFMPFNRILELGNRNAS